MLISKSIGKENRLKFLYISFIFFFKWNKKNYLGKEVFINSGCKFQVEESIYIRYKSFIGS